jgi:protein-S-isoprenylcysteine O-methyltransferase Ste14
MTANHSESSEVRAGAARRIVQVGLTLAFQAAMLFLSSGRLDWLWAWVFLGLYLLGIAVNAVLMMRYRGLETVAERGKAEGMKDWDKVVGGLWAVLYFIVILVVAGLDVRFGWTGSFSLALHIVGVAVFGAGFALFSWAMVSNAYFSTVVRIQEERGHAVCTTGPYRFVRHPGYSGAILQSLAVPLILGSWWALIAGVLAAMLMVVRTALEDRTLQEELEGYQDFTQQTRHRLVPGVW